jgi:hypothetical protein
MKKEEDPARLFEKLSGIENKFTSATMMEQPGELSQESSKRVCSDEGTP